MAVKGFRLLEDRNWAPDLDELASVASPSTRMIVVCNPNNPTGAILTPAEMSSIIHLASRSGAWILADEIYQGSERDGKATPSFWGKYDRVIVTSGLSKAYGLPGLRIGWVVAPEAIISKPVVLPRLHHHRPWNAQRHARASGAFRAWAGLAASNAREVSAGIISRCSVHGWKARVRFSAWLSPRREPSRMCATIFR